MKLVTSKDLENYLEESRGLERDYITEILRSRKIAWRIALGSSLLVLMALMALAGLTPLKMNTPFLLRVDKTTGHVDVLTTLESSEKSYGEVVDSYFLNQYIIHREGYDPHTLQASYNMTALLSDPEVQKEYYALFEGETARDKILKNHTKIFVDVHSIIPITESGTATVRFSTRTKNINTNENVLQHWIATISYTYREAQMSSSDRLINPLGFQVMSYRIDPEIIS